MLRIKQSIPGRDDYERLSSNLDEYNSQTDAQVHFKEKLLLQAVDELGYVVGELIAEYLYWTLEIKMLHVDKTNRNKGVGSSLLKSAEEFGNSKSAKVITLWTTSWQGEGFYEKYGFKEVIRFQFESPQDNPQFNIFYCKYLNSK